MDRRLHQGQSPDNHWTSTFAQQVWRRAPPRKKKTSLDDFHENFRRNSEVHWESALWPGEDIIKVLKRSSKVGRGVAVTPAALLPALLGAKVHPAAPSLAPHWSTFLHCGCTYLAAVVNRQKHRTLSPSSNKNCDFAWRAPVAIVFRPIWTGQTSVDTSE